MLVKKYVFALLVSLPLLPFLFLSKEASDGTISNRDVLLAVPFVLEFMGFYALYEFARTRGGRYSKSEQKYLLILAAGMFWLLSLPVIITVLANDNLAVSKVAFLLTMLYAFASLVMKTMQIRDSSGRIANYFFLRYLLPAGLVISLYFGLELIETITLTVNIVVAYYIVNNFTLLLKRS